MAGMFFRKWEWLTGVAHETSCGIGEIFEIPACDVACPIGRIGASQVACRVMLGFGFDLRGAESENALAVIVAGDRHFQTVQALLQGAFIIIFTPSKRARGCGELLT
jgi:hypothetical protein